MAKRGKVARMNGPWRRGRFQSGRRRGERYIDFIVADGEYYVCRISHRGTHRKSPYGARFMHYWRRVPIPKYIFKDFAALEREVMETEQLIKHQSYGMDKC